MYRSVYEVYRLVKMTLYWTVLGLFQALIIFKQFYLTIEGVKMSLVFDVAQQILEFYTVTIKPVG